ncbi:MAG: hypothetical protein M3R27_12825 [Bacteroidota bacterium]|nr:hypothetical protein [Bacteroidota bacterium]
MIRIIPFFLLCILSAPAVFSQDADLSAFEKNLLQPLCNKLINAKNDTERNKLNKELLLLMDSALSVPSSFNYPFDSIHKCVSVLTSPDNKFRILNWYLPKDDGNHEYYGFIQSKHQEVRKKGFRKQRREVVLLHPLADRTSEIKNPENAITDNKKWYGAWYYRIILKKTKTKTYYTLLGWDGNDKLTKKRIIEVLTFDSKGLPKFGADIFVMKKKYPKRVIFEYSATCSMSLKYSNRKDSIIFDHLAPTLSQLEGQYQYYCADMSYDGFGFKRGKWHYGADLNPLNEKDENDKLYKDPKDRSHSSDQSDGINSFNRDEIRKDPDYKDFKKKEKKKKAD